LAIFFLVFFAALGIFLAEAAHFLVSDFVRVRNLELVVVATWALRGLSHRSLTSGQLVFAISLQCLRNELHGDELVGITWVGDALMISALFERELLLIVHLVALKEVVGDVSANIVGWLLIVLPPVVIFHVH
jgi:hypothetical protein